MLSKSPASAPAALGTVAIGGVAAGGGPAQAFAMLPTVQTWTVVAAARHNRALGTPSF